MQKSRRRAARDMRLPKIDSLYIRVNAKNMRVSNKLKDFFIFVIRINFCRHVDSNEFLSRQRLLKIDPWMKKSLISKFCKKRGCRVINKRYNNSVFK